MSLHDLFGRHAADTDFAHWDRGRFVSRCAACGRPMIKLPGLSWQLRTAAD